MAEALATSEDGISSIRTVSEHTNLLAETIKSRLTRKGIKEIKVARWNGLASRRVILQRNPADTLTNGSVAVISLPAILKEGTRKFVTLARGVVNLV